MALNDNPAPNYGDFTVTKSNPSGSIVRFTVADTTNLLTSTKMLRSVLNDAVQQWIDSERADLDTNGDTLVKGAEEYPLNPGDGFSQFNYNADGGYAEVTLTATTNISTSGTITVSAPYNDEA